jgi:hypothetical protein
MEIPTKFILGVLVRTVSAIRLNTALTGRYRNATFFDEFRTVARTKLIFGGPVHEPRLSKAPSGSARKFEGVTIIAFERVIVERKK